MQNQHGHWVGDTALHDLAQLLLRIIDLRDPSAEIHAEGVSTLTFRFAQKINLDSGVLQVLQYAATLHDVGKVAISESVINKPSRLSRAEYIMVQQHTVLGYQLLQPLGIDPVITGVILSHHENYDGSGYPEGLKGEAIPLAARLVRITDYYEALTSHRAYRSKVVYSPTEALEVLGENRHCFDLSLLETFVDMIAATT